MKANLANLEFADSTVLVPPSAPQSLFATALNGSVALSWSAPTTGSAGVTYRVERSTASGSGYSTVTLGLSSTSYTDSSVVNGTTYYYVVTATNPLGTSLESNEASATPEAPPSSPSALAATAASGTSISLSWTDNSVTETGFKLERSFDGVSFTQITLLSSNTTSYTHTGLTTGQIYYYRVRAAGVVSDSTYSNTASATPPLAPSAPASLVATAGNANVALSWTASTGTGPISYTVRRSIASGSGYSDLTTGVSGTSYTDLTAVNGTTYYYVVIGVNIGGASTASNEDSATPLAPPPAPSTLAASAVSSTGIDLTWTDNSATESGFKLERSTDNVTFSQVATPSANAVSFSDTGLTSDQTYYYRIRAANIGGDSAYSNTASALPPAAPGAPGPLTAAGGNNTVSLSWTSATGNGSISYTIRRSTTSGSGYANLATGQTGTTYSDNTAVNGTTYYYIVYASNVGGASVNSNEASATPLSVPNAPSSLAATVASTTSLSLTWTDNATNESGFELDRSTDNSTWSQIATPGANVTSYTDTGLTTGQIYYYRIRSTNTTGDSVNSNVASETPVAPPAAPTALAASVASATSVSLSWTDNASTESGFKLERSTDNVTFAQVATPSADATSHVDIGLTTGQTYYYRVRATNGAGDSSYSNTASVTPVDPPAAPSALAVSIASATSLSLSWSDNSSTEIGFEIERSLDNATFTALTTTAANATSYTDTGLTTGTTYYYRVRAVNAGGNSSYTTSVGAAPIAPPSAPSTLAATAASSTSVSLTWTDHSSNESGFKLERSTDNSSWSEIATPAANATSHTNTGLTSDQIYYYRLRATNGGGDSSYSNTASATPPSAPGAPSSLVATAGNASVGLSWGAATGGGTITYTVLRSTTSGSGYTDVVTGHTGTSYTDTGRTNGTPYYYVVTATNVGGTSGNSNEASATPLAAPSAPSTLAATAASSTSISLSWTDNSTTESGFRLERSPDNSTWTQIATPAADATSYTDTGLTSDQIYYYRIRATNVGGDSPYSAVANATPPSAPAAPTSLAATPGHNTVAVSWTASTGGGTITYTIKRSTTSGSGYSNLATAQAGTSYNDNTAVNGNTYHYVVSATNVGGTSADSSEVSATPVAVPATPTSLSASIASATSLSLTWTDNSTTETGFKLERSTDNSTWSQIATPVADATSYTDSGLTTDQIYYYRLRASNGTGDSPYSSTVSATPMAVPSAPSTLGATAGNAQVSLSWTAATGSGTITYTVQRSTTSGSGYSNVVTGHSSTSYTDTGRTNATTYYYIVTASNAAGASSASNEASATPLAPPSAPSTLAVSVASPTSLALSWTDNSSNESGFEIERSLDNSTFFLIHTTAAGVTNYTNTALTTETTYYYRVRAVNAGGNSSYSNTASGAPVGAPSDPSTLAASAASATSVSLTWTDNASNETGFKLERSPDNSTWAQIATPAAGATSYIDTGLTSDQIYHYRLRATNAGGDSGYSNTASATPPAAPSAPTTLAATPGNASVALSWTASTGGGTITYTIGRSTTSGSGYTNLATGQSGTSYTDSTATNGTTYYYVVAASNVGGTSANSNEVSATPLAAPSPPSALAAAVASATSLNISWSDNSSTESGFKLERSTDNITFSQVATPAADATSYSDTGLSTGQIYYYRIRATNAGGDSGYSNVASATPVTPPADPIGLTPGFVTPTQIQISWQDMATDETSYEVERCSGAGCTTGWAAVSASPMAADSTTLIDTGLTQYTIYRYRVRAVNASGNSAWITSVDVRADQDGGLWVTDGPITALVRSGNQLYIGGSFTRVGPITGSGVILDTGSGTRPTGTQWPQIKGTVEVSIPDTHPSRIGGFYIGGDFTSIGGVIRDRIARILPDGTLDLNFNPSANSTVYALTLSGSTLYVGGNFTNIGGQARDRVAALDTSTGLATPFNPSANNNVYTLSLSGSTLYVGGNFTNIGGQSRSHIAALDTSTGLATSFNPSSNGTVYALILSGSTLYAGGDFMSIGGQTRNRIAALDISTGLATTFNPSSNSSVYCLTLSGSSLYAGGVFTSIGGQTRNKIAALDISTGLATPFNPSADNAVYTLSLIGSTLYTGGQFTNIGGQTRKYVAALDSATGLANSFDPGANNTVNTLSESGNVLYVGGAFSSISGQPRNHLAALDTSTGVPTAFNPSTNHTVHALTLSGDTLYAGGEFTSIGGQTRNYIAALDTSTGLTTAFNPSADTTVFTLNLSGNVLYAGGDFSNIGGQTRNSIAALDTSTGLATAFNPLADNTVYTFIQTGGTLYTGGDFSNIGGQPRDLIAALNSSTGLATSFDPSASSSVLALSLNGSTLYAGGWFMNIGGQARNRIAALDTSTGLATSFNPSANSSIRALTQNGSTLYAGGDFTTIGGQTRNYIAALDPSTGLATGFDPSANGNIFALSLSGNTIYAGGTFTNIGGQQSGQIAALDINTGTSLESSPGQPGSILASVLSASQVSLSWTCVFESVTGYEIYRAVNAGSYSLLTTSTNCSFTDSTVTTGQSYTYQVRGYNTTFNGPFGTSNTVTPGTYPNAPNSLAASPASSTSVSLSWSDNANNETGFKIERSTHAATDFTEIATVGANSTSYTSTGLTAGTTYFYRVRATNASGDSAYSNTAYATPVITAPTPPSALAATAASSTSINLTWTDNSSDETGFKLERSTDNSTWSEIATPAADATSHSDSGLTTGQIYHYRLRATNSGGDSAYTSSANATPYSAPAAPTSLAATAGNAQIGLSWNASTGSGTITYTLMRSTTSGSGYTNVATGQSGTTYTDTGLTNGTTYYYVVSASNISGTSADSSEASATPFAPTPFTYDWPFTAGTESSYTYSASSMDFTGGVVRLKANDQHDDDNTSSGFGGGATSGTTWDATNSYLRLSQSGTPSNTSSFDSSWTPAWSSLLSYWKMDNDWNDSKGSINGTAEAGIGFSTTSRVGTHSGSFDGVDDYVNLGNATALDGLSMATLQVWINPTVVDAWDTMISRHSSGTSNISFQLGGTGTAAQRNIVISISNGGNWTSGQTSTTPISAGQWHHVVAVFDGTGSGNAEKVAIYVNGVAQPLTFSGTLPSTLPTHTATLAFGRENVLNGSDATYFAGKMDEVAIWTTALAATDVATLYSRQSAKYSGTFTSRVMDALTTGQSWTNLNWAPTLPFMKPLPDYASGAVQNETSTDYTSLVGSTGSTGADNLMTGIVGLWHLDETAATAGSPNDFSDSSGGNNPGEAGGGASFGRSSLLSRAVTTDGNAAYVEITPSGNLSTATDGSFSYSAWVNLTSYPPDSCGTNSSTCNGTIVSRSTRFTGLKVQSNGKFLATLYNSTPALFQVTSGSAYPTGQWHHVAMTVDDVTKTYKLFVNGVEDSGGGGTYTGTLYNHGSNKYYLGRFSPTSPLTHGNYALPFAGAIDEVAMWNRALHANEIRQLYRRGANRLKYQVRICTASNCSDKDADVTNGQGWKGPDGTNQSYFSELHNMSTQGVNPSGTVNKTLPSMTFSNFTSPVGTSRYFQYRTILESDDTGTGCNYSGNATWCSPELKSVTVDPVHYDSSFPSISSANGTPFISLSSYLETLGAGGCASGIGYSLSLNKTNWYWWDSSKASDCTGAGSGAWCQADGTATKSNVASVIHTNTATFSTQVGTGTVYIKAYLKSTGSSKCELDKVSTDGFQ